MADRTPTPDHCHHDDTREDGPADADGQNYRCALCGDTWHEPSE